MHGTYVRRDAGLAKILSEKEAGERMITYCGGGITVTLNACVVKMLGNDDVAV
jgi:3-mercaptopyruvate sulfurtransferase SseA